MKKKLIAALSTLVCLCLSAGAANTFTAVSGNDWNTLVNWSAGIVPTNGESVVINDNVTLTNSTASLASLSVATGKTLTFDGWDTVLNASAVSVTGTVTHAQNSATTTNSLGVWVPNARVQINCDTITVATGGKISADALGFLGGKLRYAAGNGPGGGAANSINGGSHGGRAVSGNPGIAGASPYGDAASPAGWVGSGGAAGDGNDRPGGNGGGAISIVASGVVTVNGTISANGQNASYIHGGGGSGGSVAISCLRIDGSGTVSAAGGKGLTWGSSGAGGRVAIAYDAAAMQAAPLPALVFSAAAGLGGAWSNNSNIWPATPALFDSEPGTLWFTDGQFLTRLGTGTFRHSGYWVQESGTQWDLPSLKMENAWLAFPNPGFVLNVAGDMSIKGTDPRIHKATFTNGTLKCGGNLTVDKAKIDMMTSFEGSPTVDVTGNMSMLNAAVIDMRLGGASPTEPGFEGVVKVGGAMSLAGNSIIYLYSHPTNGGTALFRVGSLDVAAGSAFDANGRGYRGGKKKDDPGFGPGAGQKITGGYGGGGYGGVGGLSGPTSGNTYATAEAPTEPGSGGSAADHDTRTGGNGGGAIWIESTGSVVLNGGLLANGDPGIGTHAGGGSGGGIYIKCSAISGSGIASAGGGQGIGLWGGGGGGGRIAVDYDATAQAAAANKNVRFYVMHGSAPAEKYLGGSGTLYFPDTQLLVDSNGFLVSSGLPVIPSFTSWELDRLVVSNSYLLLPDNFTLNVTNDLVISGTSPTTHKLVAHGGVINAGSMRLDKNAGLEIYADIVSDPLTPGALVNVDGEMYLGQNTWVYPISHPTNGGSVKFSVGSLNVQATSGFDATGRGFQGGPGWYNGSPVGYSDGYGPGRGGWVNGTAYNVFSKGSGAGHGGLGVENTPVYGHTYGDYTAPVQPGSGGAGGDSTSRLGGNGGGVVWIQATGTVNVNGVLLADATTPDEEGGAGSGGSVFLTCDKITGVGGRISASVPPLSGKRRSGGAGGRIAVVYNTASQNATPVPDIRFSASAANSTDGLARESQYAGLGSLYFPDNMFLSQTDVLKLSGVWMRDDFAGWDQETLMIDNAWLDMASGETPVALTGNLVVLGTNPNLSRLVLTNSQVSVGGNTLLDGGGLVLYPGETSIASMDVAGNLVVTNKGALHVTGGITDSVFEYGAQVDVAGDMVVAANSWVYPYSHPTNGGSARFTVRNLDVLAGGGFDASKKGFAGAAAQTNGFGPGWGGFVRYKVSAMDGGGAGYGGRGGGWLEYAGNVFGETNGMFIAPAGPGSGGGGGLTVGYFGGSGGGAINIVASEDIVMNGSLLANGGSGAAGNSGGGSGGGIWVQSRKFSGTNGVISAAGGAGGGDMSGGGGGGRIAIWHGVPAEDFDRLLAGSMKRVVTNSTLETYFGTLTAVNGADKVKSGFYPPRSEPGTAWFVTVVPPAATMVIVR